MAKSKGQGESRDKIRDDIRGLMQNFDKSFGGGIDPDPDIVDGEFKQLQKLEAINYDELNPLFKKEAIEAIDSMYKFYLEIDVIDRKSYLSKKREMHGVNLSGIYFQLKTMRTVLERLAEEITGGNMLPRLVEVYTSLNDKYSDVIKSHANYILFLEDSIQNTRLNDSNTNDLTTKKSINTDTEYYVSPNQKNLVDDLNSGIGHQTTDINHGLTNPNKKDDLLESRGLSKTEIYGKDDDDLKPYGGLMDLI